LFADGTFVYGSQAIFGVWDGIMLEIYKVGSATVTRIPDITLLSFTPYALFPHIQPEELRDAIALQRAVTRTADGLHLPLNIHSWLIRDRGRIVLVDTGAGNDKDRPHARHFHRMNTPYLHFLEEAGVRPDDVDYVLLTHLHVDHVGWNTRWQNGRWVPTFPKARYVFSQAEYEHFSNPANHSERNRTSFMVREDSVDPIVAAGLAQTIEVTGEEVIEGFSFHPTPGHTANHAAIRLRSAGETAIFGGDVAHHPVQVTHPEWNSVFDAFADEARASRRRCLQQASREGAVFFTAHFAGSSVGRVSQAGEGFTWTYL
jgi:glyoxylase-like metal-dependent hydrolase (beta-lactamase superfamily II)